jgi:hypothetical protein
VRKRWHDGKARRCEGGLRGDLRGGLRGGALLHALWPMALQCGSVAVRSSHDRDRRGRVGHLRGTPALFTTSQRLHDDLSSASHDSTARIHGYRGMLAGNDSLADGWGGTQVFPVVDGHCACAGLAGTGPCRTRARLVSAAKNIFRLISLGCRHHSVRFGLNSHPAHAIRLFRYFNRSMSTPSWLPIRSLTCHSVTNSAPGPHDKCNAVAIHSNPRGHQCIPAVTPRRTDGLLTPFPPFITHSQPIRPH